MARWADLAEWRGPTRNQGGLMVEHRGVVLHIAEGTYTGTIAWQLNPDSEVSSHFIVSKTGETAQMVDTRATAWTQRLGNGHWLSVECEGYHTGPLTAAQIEACARVLARGHQEYGYPLQLATSPSGQGLGHHSMGAESGVDWGHSRCPGGLIKAQKPAILARALELAQGDTMATSWDQSTSDNVAYTLLNGGDGVPLHARVELVRQDFAALVDVVRALDARLDRLTAAPALAGRLSVSGTLDLAPTTTT